MRNPETLDLPDYVARAKALEPLIRDHADEAERERRLSPPIARAFVEQGLYRVAAPKAFHGAEADPMTQIKVIEAASYADGAAGWNLMIGIETFGIIGPAFHKNPALIADPTTVMASSTAAVGRADKIDGGWRINGQWQFVSGIHNAQIFGATVQLYDNGERLSKVNRYAIIPEGSYEILDTWHVSGLRGSGSHDVRVDNVEIDDDHIIAAMGDTPGDSPLLRFPLMSRLSYNKAAVGFGIARAGIDAFVDVATGKVPRFTSKSLRERPFAQRAVAKAEARLRGARAAVLDAAEAMWDKVCAHEEVSIEDRAVLQLLCSDAAAAAAEAVDMVAEAAGTTANQIGHPLERISRDVRVVRQHATVAPHHIEDAGRVLLGVEPESLMLVRPRPRD